MYRKYGGTSAPRGGGDGALCALGVPSGFSGETGTSGGISSSRAGPLRLRFGETLFLDTVTLPG